MNVEMKLGTSNDPGTKVIITSNIRIVDVATFDRWLRVQKLARDWLKRELDKK
jgi:hypothetical protein